jgi:Fur family ferric uptake transcriptional regulator
MADSISMPETAAPLGDDPRSWAAERLRHAGLRVTAVRVAVLTALADAPHADTETTIARVRATLGSVSTQAVYNVLAALTDAELVRRIEPAGSPARYEVRVGDNHHHVVCRRCGATADVDCAVGERPCLTPSETHGYLLDEAEVTFWGLCPTCQTASRPSESTTDSASWSTASTSGT